MPRPLKIVVAPDKLKDSLSAPAAAEAIAEGLRSVAPDAEIDLCPMADGGEGTVDALARATGGRLLSRRVTGPLPEMIVEATYALLGDGRTAVIEMAAASGLHLLRPEQRDPLKTTTYGTGELIRAAIEAGARKIILGIGGSATVDGGLGCAQACGMRIWMGDKNREVSSPATGADLLALRSMTRPVVAEGVELLVACDVRNPLTGPEGAARVYGPQKGATPQDVVALDKALERLAHLAQAEEFAKSPGAGAAGGLGFAMLAFFGAKLRPGIELVIDAVDLRRRLAGTDLCITAEGRFDASSLAGKTPVGVAGVCHELGIPCVALAGSVDLADGTRLPAGLKAVVGICDRPMSLEDSLRQAPRLLRQAGSNILRLILARS